MLGTIKAYSRFFYFLLFFELTFALKHFYADQPDCFFLLGSDSKGSQLVPRHPNSCCVNERAIFQGVGVWLSFEF